MRKIPDRVIAATKALVAAALIAWLLKRGTLDLSAVGRALDHWPLLLLIAATYYFQLLLISWRWNLLLRAQGFPFRLRETFSLTMIGTLFNLITPSSVGGDVMKGYYVQQGAAGRRAEALATIVLDRVLGLLSLLIVAALAAVPGLLSSGSNPQLRALAVSSIGGAFAGLAGLAIAIHFSRTGGDVEAANRVVRFVVRAFRSLAEYRERPGVLLRCIAAGIFSYLLACGAFYYSARAIGAPDFPVRFLFLVPLGLCATALPLSPAGIGVGQVAFAELFRISSEGRYTFGANAFTVFQTLQFLVGLTGFFFYLAYRRRRL